MRLSPFANPKKSAIIELFGRRRWMEKTGSQDLQNRDVGASFFFFAAALVRKETGHFASTNLTAFTEGHHQVRPSTGFFCWINITNRPSSVQFFFLVVGFVVDK